MEPPGLGSWCKHFQLRDAQIPEKSVVLLPNPRNFKSSFHEHKEGSCISNSFGEASVHKYGRKNVTDSWGGELLSSFNPSWKLALPPARRWTSDVTHNGNVVPGTLELHTSQGLLSEIISVKKCVHFFNVLEFDLVLQSTSIKNMGAQRSGPFSLHFCINSAPYHLFLL